MIEVLCGDALTVLKTLPDNSVQCVVTSPPYFGLRDYGCAGQIGMESTPDAYMSELVAVFREVRRVLRDDGTCWLNLGDSYAGYHGNKKCANDEAPSNKPGYIENMRGSTVGISGLKPKDLIGIPWRVAFALQSDGWWLRSEITWCKKSSMPESVTDRPSSATEKIFLLTKSAKYFYDAEAVKEEATSGPSGTVKKDQPRTMNSTPLYQSNLGGRTQEPVKQGAMGIPESGKRNLRNFWLLGPDPYPGSHFATMPRKLAETCVLAGSRFGDTVLDPFGGSGTTGEVAQRLGRNAILIELNPDYLPLIHQRTQQASLELKG